MMRRLLFWITSRPGSVVLTLGLATVAGLALLPRLELDTRGASFVPVGTPVLEADRKMAGLFGTGDLFLLGIEAPTAGAVTTPEGLDWIDRLTETCRTVPGIDATHIASLTTAERVLIDQDVLTIEPLVKRPIDRDSARRIRQLLAADPLEVGRLVSADGSAAALVLPVASDGDLPEILTHLRTLVAASDPPPGWRLHLAGSAVAELTLGEHVLEDLALLLPLVLGGVGLLLFTLFRRWWAAVLPLTTVGVAIVWTFALVAALGRPIYVVTSILPVILIAIGTADAIHVLARFQRTAGNTSAQRVVASLESLVRPIFVTSVTTAFGFLTLTMTSSPPLRDLGWFAAFGVMATMVVSLTLLPAGLVWAARSQTDERSRHRDTADGGRAERVFARFAAFSLDRSREVLALACLLGLTATFGAARLQVQDSWVENFDRTSDLRRAADLFDRHFSGSHVLDLVVTGSDTGFFHHHDGLERLDGLARWLGQRGEVGDILGVTEAITRIEGAWRGDTTDGRIPSSAEAVAEAFLLYEMFAGPEALSSSLHPDGRHARLRVFLPHADYRKTAALVRDLEAEIDRRFDHVDVLLAGDVMVSQAAVGRLVGDQLASLGTAGLGILLIASIAARSLLLGLIQALVIALSVLAVFGWMGFLGMPLGIATSTFGSLGLGIGVDYGVHLIDRFRRERSARRKLHEAILRAWSRCDPPILVNALVVAGGFLVLLASGIPPLRHLGLITGLGMGLAAAVSLLVLPPLLERLGRRGADSGTPHRQRRAEALAEACLDQFPQPGQRGGIEQLVGDVEVVSRP